MDVTSAELLARFETGDGEAAEELFARYVERLTRLARSRLSPKLSRRLDAEDVVLSAYRSFFLAAEQGRFSLAHSGDLWRLLVRITLHKLYRSAAHHRAAMRSIERETSAGDTDPLLSEFTAREPTPDEAVALTDEVEWLFAKLPVTARRALELRLQGESVADIAAEIGQSERHVRRSLALARKRIAQRQREFGMAVDNDKPRRARDARKESRFDRSAQRTLRATSIDHVKAPLKYGDYLLTQLLGSGGVGKVYRALHRPTGKTVAVKYLRKTFFSDSNIVPRFVTEARIVATLQHPGIVAVHGLGTTPHGGLFIAMDFIDGPNLEAVASEELPPPIDVVHWIAQAAKVIEYVHGQNVIHCDLKPSNLLLACDSKVRVTDFGFARALRDETPNRQGIAGTAGYMAPEQIDPSWGEIGPRTDVYGLGAVLFHLLTGQPPATGRRIADVLSQVASTQPLELRNRFPPNVDDIVEEICLRCLQKLPADRFATAEALAAALQEVV